MKKDFDFKELFIFDMANNHQGRVEHGHRIISEIAQVAHANGIRGALKFQFRQLDSFIHPAHMEGSSNKHIPRFLSTRLSKEEFVTLVEEVRKRGLVTMCTPFDEESVDMIVELGIEVVKVASCSATDWPLLEKIADCNKPVVFSTGGLTWKQIGYLVSFFDHRRVHFAIEHCVSIYPTPTDKLQLGQIELLCRRYPDKIIGFSTHEDPDDLAPVQVAVAKGAQILERHVGVETDEIQLNAYSSTPVQIDRWIKAAQNARTLCKVEDRKVLLAEEAVSLDSLKRGVYARRPLKKGACVQYSDVFFAMPYVAGQLSSGDFKDGIVVGEGVDKDQALMLQGLQIPTHPDKQVLFDAIHTIKGMLNEARIVLSTDFETEFSHHYGIINFPQVGAAMITCVNRSYCKKLIIQTPGQRNPMHYHKKKEETFQVLYGVLEMEIEGRRRTLYPGDIVLVQQGVWHEFWTDTGVIFEEISTMHLNDDSFYEDKAINRMERTARKTIVNQWGRYQI
jgi:N-acetylneuraminate synthase